ncbi:Uncharacterised protein [Mycobacteroides abscessus]|nr:Uncharacterised protein [Mycobacteroides abscessus]
MRHRFGVALAPPRRVQEIASLAGHRREVYR